MQNKQTKAIAGTEADFDIGELFFSRTDGRGVIQSGNSVFQRVSVYSWEELIGSPHKLIRHPDMPKAVFYLLWDTIKAGKPIGAYVKNLAKNGQYYWVFALVTPIEGGYLSVRLKPTSRLFQKIQDEYRKLRKVELDTDMAPMESAKILLDRLAELGWRDYAAFMADALVQEIGARETSLQGAPSATGEGRRRIMQISSENLADAEKILTLCKKLKYSAVNLSIHSAKNAAHRQIFGVISENFARVSDRLRSQVELFIDNAQKVIDQINEGLFLSGTAGMQVEISQVFKTEDDQAGNVDRQREARLLESQSAEYTALAEGGLKKMLSEISEFHWRCNEMVEHVGALGVTGSVGLIETARLDRGGAVAFDLLEQTAEIQRSIEAVLKDITARNVELENEIRSANNLHSLAKGGGGERVKRAVA